MKGDLDAVIDHYEHAREEDRLQSGLSALERVRTCEILGRHLPGAPGRIIDIGGGTGVYAGWLLDESYDVHLIDLTPRHVRRALVEFGERPFTAEVGDARHLGAPDGGFDAALLLGPLYHLVERVDRLTALAQARRVVRPGGVVAVGAINRLASLFDGLVREFLFDPEFLAIVRRALGDGRHFNPDNHPHWFTTAFFHRPEQLAEEIADAGLTVVEMLGVEGLAGWLPHLEARWADAADRETILEATRMSEAEPAVLGLSAHLLAIASVDG